MGLSERAARQLIPDTWAATIGDTIAGAYDQVLNVRRATRTKDGMGGHTRTWSTVGIDVPARVALNMSMAAQPAVGGQLEDQPEWVVAMPLGTDVRLGDRLVTEGPSSATMVVTEVTTEASHPVEVQVLANTLEA